MDTNKLKDELTRAGNTYDGHVTIGSLNEQMKVIQDWLAHLCTHPAGSVQEHRGITLCTRCMYRSDMNLPGRIPLPEPKKKTVRTFIQEEN